MPKGYLLLAVFFTFKALAVAPAPTLNSLFERSTKGSKRPSATYTFSGAANDSIDYAELCLATDNTCSSCSAPVTEITDGAIAYTTGGTTYNVPPASIAAYLARAGVGAGTYHVGLYVKSQTTGCSASAAYCSTDKDSTDAKLCMSAAFNGTVVTSLTQNDNGSVVLDEATLQFAYVSSSADNGVYKCSLNADGTFGTCATTEKATWEPFQTSFARINGSQVAYVADNNSCTIKKCDVNASGVFSNCATTAHGGACPTGVMLATVGSQSVAYVSDNVGESVTHCTLNPATGAFDTCTPMSRGRGGAWNPFSVFFSYVMGTQFAYVADPANNLVYVCSLNTNGTFAGCSTTQGDSPGWAPTVSTITTIGGSPFAYVPNQGIGGSVFKCSVNNDGTLGTCVALPGAWDPRSIQFATVEGTKFAYVSDIGGLVYKCTLNGDGTFNACAATPASPPSWNPRSTTFSFAR